MSAATEQAVTARIRNRKVAPAVTAAPKALERTPTALKEAFARVADSIEKAAGVEEEHAWSGDSDRILAVAAYDVERFANWAETPEQARSYAFDVTALIKAARLVPGDVESPARTEFLEQAARELCWIIGSESPHSELIDPKVSRTSPPITPSKARPTNCSAVSSDAMGQIDFLTNTLAHVNSVLTVLIDMFSSPVAVENPFRIAGTLEYLADALATADVTAQDLQRGVLPTAASSAVSQARSLAQLLHHLIHEGHLDWSYANSVHSNYFDAINSAVHCALQTMEVKNHE